MKGEMIEYKWEGLCVEYINRRKVGKTYSCIKEMRNMKYISFDAVTPTWQDG